MKILKALANYILSGCEARVLRFSRDKSASIDCSAILKMISIRLLFSLKETMRAIHVRKRYPTSGRRQGDQR